MRPGAEVLAATAWGELQPREMGLLHQARWRAERTGGVMAPPCHYRPCSDLAKWQTYTSSTQWRFCDGHATKAERAHARAGLYFRKFRLT